MDKDVLTGHALYMRYTFAILLMLSPATFAQSVVPEQSQISGLCSQASEQITAAVSPAWSEASIQKMDDQALSIQAARLDQYVPFQLYNSNSVRASEFITRYLLADAARVILNSEVKPQETDILQIEPALTVLETELEHFVAHPESAKVSTESELYEQSDPDRDYELYAGGFQALCNTAGPALPQCQETFETLINFARPSFFNGGNLFAAFGSYVRFRSSHRFLAGLSLFSSRALKRMRVEFKHEATQPSDVQNDLYHAYLDSGMSRDDATDASFLVLMVYSTRGAAHQYVFHKPDANQIALEGLLTSISYFDRIQLSRKQHSYLLPATIKLDCPYGKPYHFWLAAGLAYFTQRSGHPAMTSAFASYTLGIAYDVLMVANGRDYHKLLKLAPFNTTVNQERSDLFYKELGSFYGAYFKTGHPQGNYQSLLYTQYKKTGQTPPWLMNLMRKNIDPRGSLDKFPEFYNLIQPYAAFLGMQLKAQW